MTCSQRGDPLHLDASPVAGPVVYSSVKIVHYAYILLSDEKKLLTVVVALSSLKENAPTKNNRRMTHNPKV